MAFEYFTVCIIQLFRTEQNQAYYNCESIIDIYLRLFTDLVTNNTTDGCSGHFFARYKHNTLS